MTVICLYLLPSHLCKNRENLASHWKPSQLILHFVIQKIHNAIKQDKGEDKCLVSTAKHFLTHSFLIFMSIEMVAF